MRKSGKLSITPNIIAGKGVRAPRVFVLRCLSRVIASVAEEKLSKRARTLLESSSEMSIVFVSSQEIRRLNREFRGKDKATDVLSFESVEDGFSGEGTKSLGELVIALEVIRTQAREHALTLNDELAYMILHGVLHLLGYDHEKSPAGERRMFAIQDRIFEAYKGRW